MRRLTGRVLNGGTDNPGGCAMFAVILLAAVLGVALAAFAVPAQAAGHPSGRAHAAAMAHAKRCTGEKVSWRTGTNYGVTGFHDFGSAWFTANPGRCSWLKDQILCQNQDLSFYSKTSSVYRGVGVVDKIACDLNDPAYRFSLDLNGHWRELCTLNGHPGCAWSPRGPPARRAVHAILTAHRRTSVTGYLVDGNSPPGEGTAASPRPGTTPWDGEPTQQVGTGAWQIKFTGLDWSRIPLANPNASSLCYTDVSGTVKLRPCSRNTDYQYWREGGTGPGFNLRNRGSGKYLCAAGGVGSGDVVVRLADCSVYHHTWVIQDNP